jgi:hypothetical protein
VDEKSTVDSYLNELAQIDKIRQPVALHFYLPNDLAEKVIDSIDATLK